MKSLDHYWYSINPVSCLLWPLALLFKFVSTVRHLLYRNALLTSHSVPVPVIIVGNITVGGTGKTPTVIWLAHYLREQGYRPGIVSRGYGGRSTTWPQWVTPQSDPTLVGDEPLLLAQQSGCPVVVAPARITAVEQLLRHSHCDLIIGDDGLQHYALQRDIEIVVVDGARRFGNGWALPAGPLREPQSRLEEVDIVLVNGEAREGECSMRLEAAALYPLTTAATPFDVRHFSGCRVHGVAGIGNPPRFFATLRALGMVVIEHPFPDHYRYRANDLSFADDLPIIMTEKDAVKCRDLPIVNGWYLTVTAQMSADFTAKLATKLAQVNKRKSA